MFVFPIYAVSACHNYVRVFNNMRLYKIYASLQNICNSTIIWVFLNGQEMALYFSAAQNHTRRAGPGPLLLRLHRAGRRSHSTQHSAQQQIELLCIICTSSIVCMLQKYIVQITVAIYVDLDVSTRQSIYWVVCCRKPYIVRYIHWTLHYIV